MAMNKEELREYRKLWWKRNRARASEYRKNWRLADPERAKAFDKARRKKYADKIRERNRLYAAAHRPWARNNAKKWRQKNPEAMMDNQVRYRMKMRSQGTRLSHGLTKRLFAAQQGLCARCHCDLTKSKFHRDHIIPISRGGPHCDSNIQLLCPACNLSKGAR